MAAQSGVMAIAAGYYHTVALLYSPALTATALVASSNGHALVLSWPTNAVGFTLESALQLTPPVTWVAVTNPPALHGGQWTVTNIFSAPERYYQLRKP
jgi:hypothetical protein